MRYLWVDYAKAIGIILVVYGHVARGLFGAGMPIDEFSYKITDSIIYSFHMPLFFFLSGLFFYNSLIKRGWKKFLANKIDTLVYIYILWSLLQGTIEVLLSHWTNAGATFPQVFSLLWHPRSQFWFLYALFFIICLAIPIYIKSSPKYFLLVFVISSVAYLLKPMLYNTLISAYLAEFFCFFALGIYFETIQAWVYKHLKIIFPLSLLMFLIAQYIFHGVYGLSYMLGGITTWGLAIISILFISTFCMTLTHFKIPYLSTIGACSMGIYLAHMLTGSGMRIFLTKILHINNIPTNLVVGCIFGILLPVLLMKLSPKLKLAFLFTIPEKFSVERWYQHRLQTTT
jgi:fucose 4-O-acetylase-like acetyltransferase